MWCACANAYSVPGCSLGVANAVGSFLEKSNRSNHHGPDDLKTTFSNAPNVIVDVLAPNNCALGCAALGWWHMLLEM